VTPEVPWEVVREAGIVLTAEDAALGFRRGRLRAPEVVRWAEDALARGEDDASVLALAGLGGAELGDRWKDWLDQEGDHAGAAPASRATRPERRKPRASRAFEMRMRGLEPPRGNCPTRPSTLRNELDSAKVRRIWLRYWD
jgi:hypothetical protein